MKLSVIAPVYNVAAALENCIQSLATQDYKDTEIILIDDGSTDKSGEICDRFANTFDNLLIIPIA